MYNYLRPLRLAMLYCWTQWTQIFKYFELSAITHEYGRFEFYIGLTDLEEEDVWIWQTSGRILSSTANTPWDDGEPNNVGSEDCALVQGINLFLIDVKCSLKFHIICEKSDSSIN